MPIMPVDWMTGHDWTANGCFGLNVDRVDWPLTIRARKKKDHVTHSSNRTHAASMDYLGISLLVAPCAVFAYLHHVDDGWWWMYKLIWTNLVLLVAAQAAFSPSSRSKDKTNLWQLWEVPCRLPLKADTQLQVTLLQKDANSAAILRPPSANCPVRDAKTLPRHLPTFFIDFQWYHVTHVETSEHEQDGACLNIFSQCI